MNRNEIEVVIDELTPCLIHRQSGEKYQTRIQPLTETDLNQLTKEQGWVNFNWNKEFSLPKRLVYKLTVAGSDDIQGLVSLEVAQGYVDVFLVESAPWNVGSTSQVFVGVGAHLFAFACKVSFDLGFEGVIAFTSKTKLIDHYKEKLGAVTIGGHLMTIETHAAKKLVNRYFREGET